MTIRWLRVPVLNCALPPPSGMSLYRACHGHERQEPKLSRYTYLGWALAWQRLRLETTITTRATEYFSLETYIHPQSRSETMPVQSRHRGHLTVSLNRLRLRSCRRYSRGERYCAMAEAVPAVCCHAVGLSRFLVIL